MSETPRLLDRRLAALCLLLAPLLEVVEAALSPLRDTTTAADISAIAAHQQRFTISVVAGLLSTLLYVPAFLGASRLTAARNPRLTAVATALLVLAMLGFAGVRMGQGFELAAVHEHTSPSVAGKLLDATAGTAPGAMLMAVFLLGSTLGLWLLSIALWRSRSVPRPAALALAAFPLIDLGVKGHASTVVSHLLLLGGLIAIAAALHRQTPAIEPVVATTHAAPASA